MPPIKLFMAPVRWNQTLLLCQRGRAVTWLKHGRPLPHGGKDFMEQAWMLLGYKQCTEDAMTLTWLLPCATVQREDDTSVSCSMRGGAWGLACRWPALCWCCFVPLTFVVMARIWPFFVRAMLWCWILMLWCCAPATHGNKQSYF